MKLTRHPLCIALLLAATAACAADFPLLANGRAASIVVDKTDAEVVRIAAKLLTDDLQRVGGVKSGAQPTASTVIAGTLGQSPLVDRLAREGKLKDLDKITGRWEATLVQIIDRPTEGIERALVVVGSDRRGTAFGLTKLSEKIGISPWTWWADVPAPRQKTLTISLNGPEVDAPAVKYRGIFINDEDWGLHQWARQTFEPENRGIGPKTYEKVFELMLRLRLNYLWPAMHEVSREFHLIPENIELADRYGIVAGASHCEPMLFNNAKWNVNERGRWDYSINRSRILAAWEHEAKTRGDKEAVWGLGIRGIHDRGMEGPPDPQTRIGILGQVFGDQRALLDRYVTKAYGPVAQAFVPYKEVLPLYDAGLKVPEDVTLVWVDDNFGYIRRLGTPAERNRPGGAGVYWHLSYYGFPHSYTWLNTTAPALVWEELGKAWDNDARNLWVVNVGDIKPMEIGVDYFSKLAWNPEAMGPDSQPRFLRTFAAQQFGKGLSEEVGRLLERFYRLGTLRKPELMNREWALGLSDAEAFTLRRAYLTLLREERRLSLTVPAESRDAYFELVGFPARVLGNTGLIFLTDRDVQFGDASTGGETEIARLYASLDVEVGRYNNEVAGGKWKGVMPGTVTGRNLTAWNSQVRWPWGEKPGEAPKRPAADARVWRDADTAEERSSAGVAKWTSILGLGTSFRAVALKPAGLASSWKEDDASAPTLTYRFESGGSGDLLVDFLPSFRLYPGAQLRVAVSLDDGPVTVVEVPGSNGKEDENGPNRRFGVQNNYVRARVPLPGLTPGKHTLKIRAIDPGIVIDRLSLR
ncbi:hypothetical protein EON82_13365 [bacterium]|nr:MAG: hypothetical protein EON82_13365 [bacterium]